MLLTGIVAFLVLCQGSGIADEMQSPSGASAAVPLPQPKPEPPTGQHPAVLSPDDMARYARIFTAQQRADWATADRLIAELHDDLLLGHVLAQRYLHPTGWRSTFAELSSWLERYADQPDARRIYDLAISRMPEDATPPPAPRDGRLLHLAVDAGLTPARSGSDEPDWSHLPATQRSALQELVRRIRRDIRAGRNDGALDVLRDPQFVGLADPLTEDRMAAEVAQALFIAGDDRMARALAAPAVERSGSAAPLAGWIVGLASFRQGDLAASRRAFEILAAGPRDEELVIAGAYWAARLNLMTGRPDKVSPYLQVASTYPYSFYGLLARHALGVSLRPDDRLPTLSDVEHAALATMPEVRRAIALVEAGQQHRADREFDGVSAGDRPGLAVAVLRLAADLGLPATQFRLASELLVGYGERFDAALYPVPPWRPQDGFSVDPALLYAIMRRESGFYAFLRSEAGARGPMQIMPGTAAYISGDDGYLGAKRNLLNDPRVALDLAQNYIRYLLDLAAVNGNLFFVLAAYNAGPGNLQRWLATEGATYDPLLFIETIPVRETRFFVERVMASYWMYCLRLGAEVPTLDMVASGMWPLYRDGESAILAGN